MTGDAPRTTRALLLASPTGYPDGCDRSGWLAAIASLRRPVPLVRPGVHPPLVRPNNEVVVGSNHGQCADLDVPLFDALPQPPPVANFLSLLTLLHQLVKFGAGKHPGWAAEQVSDNAIVHAEDRGDTCDSTSVLVFLRD